MNILVAPNSMKGSLSSFQIADIIERAFISVSPTLFKVRKMPIADGGDGTIDVLIKALKLEKRTEMVYDPLGRLIYADYAFSDKIAVIEMANASGIKLLKESELNPLKATSYGTGQLIQHVINKGIKKIYIGIGGSATIDGGMGMLEALGIRFLDKSRNILKGNGENLGRINLIDTSNFIIGKDIEIIIISDVDNPLLGADGAVKIFGIQKGATPMMIEKLERNLLHYANIIEQFTGQNVKELKSGGAAGGIATALFAFSDAKIKSGADYILDLISIDDSLRWADVVITGEGKIDEQTFMNKAPYAIALRAKKMNKGTIGIAGSIYTADNNLFSGLFSIINQPMNLEYAMKNSNKLLFELSVQIARLLKLVNQE